MTTPDKSEADTLAERMEARAVELEPSKTARNLQLRFGSIIQRQATADLLTEAAAFLRSSPSDGGGRRANDHAWNCDWHLDQHPHECTCGAITRPSPQPSSPAGREALIGTLRAIGGLHNPDDAGTIADALIRVYPALLSPPPEAAETGGWRELLDDAVTALDEYRQAQRHAMPDNFENYEAFFIGRAEALIDALSAPIPQGGADRTAEVSRG